MRQLLIVLFVSWCVAGAAAQGPAQTPPATPAAPAPSAQAGTAAPPSPPAPPAAVPRGRSPRNVRFEITITDTVEGKPVTKVMSLTAMEGGNNPNSIRSVASLPGKAIPLNLDVRQVSIYDDGGIRAQVNVEYQPYVSSPQSQQPGLITAGATSVFADGRRTQILQTTDPISDRRTTIDVTATTVK
jgi:hypothetical protein